MTAAIMQPYFMPYIGYFQMVYAVDAFVFYDDVNYIKQGWINRNRILINGESRFITVPLIQAGSFKMIKDTEIDYRRNELVKLLKAIELAYKKAPFFEEIFPLTAQILEKEYINIAELAKESIVRVSDYLSITTRFYTSSTDFPESRGLDKAERLQAICKKINAEKYINAIGGQELYSKEEFFKENIQLQFIKSLPIAYKQFGNEFVPWLSILDVLMFNSKEEVKKMLTQFELV
ncbi:MAG TPA: WbqC family protein [Saprospiraceae bacterium]|nr:WbqC family protein [Chitinophagaceae bacterium]HNC38979.1 WbqC family protein [Chitinophagaceae bacterium]HNF49288.1 WbqC family protein [Chitinophagales bacterium]HNJ57329.1 WbqC family protein [Chitinophagaceae bacterium]HNN69495.1 WbqC family protein [Saprospiraceae bacterium]